MKTSMNRGKPRKSTVLRDYNSGDDDSDTQDRWANYETRDTPEYALAPNQSYTREEIARDRPKANNMEETDLLCGCGKPMLSFKYKNGTKTAYKCAVPDRKVGNGWYTGIGGCGGVRWTRYSDLIVNLKVPPGEEMAGTSLHQQGRQNFKREREEGGQWERMPTKKSRTREISDSDEIEIRLQTLQKDVKTVKKALANILTTCGPIVDMAVDIKKLVYLNEHSQSTSRKDEISQKTEKREVRINIDDFLPNSDSDASEDSTE